MITPMTVYSCPICSSELSIDHRVFRCENNHAFDIAKGGYVNLLPANRKRSLSPGDNAEMVGARRRFLGAGHYRPLADQLITKIGHPQRLVDLGCGEGYFTAAFCQAATEVYGVDISKVAVNAACKQAPASFVVASTSHLPFLNEVFDAATALMAPTSPDILRVLKPSGLFCRVLPDTDHFVELRERAYQELRGHRPPSLQLEGFKHLEYERVKFSMSLNHETLMDLIAMTPMQFKTSRDFREQISQIHQLSVTADFRIDLFRRI